MLDFLIIGKNGQLATELSKLLFTKNINFKAFSRGELDVSDEKSLKKINNLKPKIIVNTASYHVLSDCEKYPLKAFEINSVAVGNLAKISHQIGAKFITISTNYVFDGEKNSSYSEDDNVNPLQVYGLSKLAGEFYAMNNHKEGTYIIRTCGLYGNGKIGSKDKKGNFILKVIDEANTNGIVTASSIEIINPTNAKDLANAILKLLSSKAKPGIYHLVNEGEISWYEFAKLIIKYKKIKAKVVINNDFSGLYKRPMHSTLENKKARKLGIILSNIDNGLIRYLDEI